MNSRPPLVRASALAARSSEPAAVLATLRELVVSAPDRLVVPAAVIRDSLVSVPEAVAPRSV